MNGNGLNHETDNINNISSKQADTVKLRKYKPEDLPEIVRLFTDTIHNVNIKDYSEDQVKVWADAGQDLLFSNGFFMQLYTIAAVSGHKLLGYGNIDTTGYLDHLYIHKDYQGQHIASAICDELERHAFAGKAAEITVHASITARPFFEKRGYKTVTEQFVRRQNMILKNYLMIRRR